MSTKKDDKTSVEHFDMSPQSMEAREAELASLAYIESKRRIKDGTASSQLLCHFLKVGSTREREEKRLLAEKAKLAEAKSDQLDRAKDQELSMDEVLKAIKLYSGQEG